MAAVPPPTADWLALPAPVHADLSPDGSRLVVTTEENRLDALVRFFHARMRAGTIR